MGDLWWPGSERAGEAFGQAAGLAAMVRVEEAWLDVLGRSARLSGLLDEADLGALALHAEVTGNPVPELVRLLRERSDEPLVHRGLTSQDVVDNAVMLLLREAVAAVAGELTTQVGRLSALAQAHRSTVMAARTLGQHAVPTTFALKAATWLTGVLDAQDDLRALSFPVQLGGAAGTLAAVMELGLDPHEARTRLSGSLGLAPVPPWHTTRRPLTRCGDALVACTDSWARIANDVVLLSRPEVGELSEGETGGSSTMPHKQNPVLSVLIRRAGLAAPHLAAALHTAAADQADERATGGWHAEWDTLRSLARHALVAASQTTSLLDGLQVRPDRMRATVETASAELHAEQRALAAAAGRAPVSGDYLGAADAIVDEVLARASATTGRNP